MTKLKIVPAKKIIKWLEDKGFEIIRQKGSHVFLQKEELFTTVPLHNKDLPRGTILKILKDCDISKETYKEEL